MLNLGSFMQDGFYIDNNFSCEYYCSEECLHQFHTQEDYEKLLGVSFASINRWEAGRHEPTIKIKRKIVDLCKENNISLED